MTTIRFRCLVRHMAKFMTITTTTVFMIISVTTLQAAPISLKTAVQIAQDNDPWITGSYQRERATRAQSIAAGQLPDPVVSIGLANMPIDTFDFNQEPMTQLQMGVSQVIPRGDSLSLKQQQLEELSRQQPFMRQDRAAKVELAVSQLWLELYRSEETIRLIEKDRSLFEYLVDVAEISYSSALGRSRQQDLVRSQLELTRLEDRLTVLHQNKAETQKKLSEWLPITVWEGEVLHELPAITLHDSVGNAKDDPSESLFIQNHPMIKTLDQQITASKTNVSLTEQKYQPQWGVSSSYGIRDDAPGGQSRSDFFSVGISFDLPIFTERRQDKEVEAAVSSKEALKTDRILMLRAIQAQLSEATERLKWLENRQALYSDRLLREMQDQAEASLTAYTNDEGDFAEVVRARIAELNTNIDYLNITVDRLKTIAELNYLATSASQEVSDSMDE